MKVLLVSVVVVILDQLSKLSVRYFFDKFEVHNLVGSFIRLVYIENEGMAFGIQFGSQAFFTVFASVATLVIFIYIIRARFEKLATRVALSLILGGAIGNLIDRFLYGKVTDFINVGIGDFRWKYIFNIADSAVTVGMIILLFMIFLDKKKGKQEQEEGIGIEGQYF